MKTPRRKLKKLTQHQRLAIVASASSGKTMSGPIYGMKAAGYSDEEIKAFIEARAKYLP
jgi:hypothetical protein